MAQSTHILEQVSQGGKAESDPALSREAVLGQLDKLLASRFFSNSKRCPAMLRYVVNQVVAGQTDSLKERSLGIEVFHRAPDYDNNSDPIVRLAAGEIRKRLAQYYCEPEHAAELRISLPAGSYLPEFHWPEPLPSSTPPEAAAPAEVRSSSRPIHFRLLPTFCSLLLLIVAIALLWFWMRRPASDRFWTGILKANSPVLICVGQPDRFAGDAATRRRIEDSNLGNRLLNLDQISMPDAIAVARIAGLLAKRNLDYTLKGEESVTLEDLRRGPAILVSGADNPWTLRATRDLRFHFESATAGNPTRVRISDRNNPGSYAWEVDFSIAYTALTQDYAIVGRFDNPNTGEPNVVAAGIGANGTLVASECLAEVKCLNDIVERDGSKGRKNIEAVLGTQVIDGKSGPPVVLAVHSW